MTPRPFQFPKYVGHWTIGGKSGLSVSVIKRPQLADSRVGPMAARMGVG